MAIYCFTLPGYVHLYRSLIRFCRMNRKEAAELVYLLNTANLDSYRYSRSKAKPAECKAYAFRKRLDGDERPYRTEVQLYKALRSLDRNIRMEALTSEQRDAVHQMRNRLMQTLQYFFHLCYGVDIEDKSTVYRACAPTLIPVNEEPTVCLLDEWRNLNSA